MVDEDLLCPETSQGKIIRLTSGSHPCVSLDFALSGESVKEDKEMNLRLQTLISVSNLQKSFVVAYGVA